MQSRNYRRVASRKPWFTGYHTKMIGKCPHCEIELKNPPFNGRETNEVIVVLTYRKLIETGVKIKSINSSGFCPVCRATPKDLKEQKTV